MSFQILFCFFSFSFCRFDFISLCILLLSALIFTTLLSFLWYFYNLFCFLIFYWVQFSLFTYILDFCWISSIHLYCWFSIFWWRSSSLGCWYLCLLSSCCGLFFYYCYSRPFFRLLHPLLCTWHSGPCIWLSVYVVHFLSLLFHSNLVRVPSSALVVTGSRSFLLINYWCIIPFLDCSCFSVYVYIYSFALKSPPSIISFS